MRLPRAGRNFPEGSTHELGAGSKSLTHLSPCSPDGSTQQVRRSTGGAGQGGQPAAPPPAATPGLGVEVSIQGCVFSPQHMDMKYHFLLREPRTPWRDSRFQVWGSPCVSRKIAPVGEGQRTCYLGWTRELTLPHLCSAPHVPSLLSEAAPRTQP